MSLAVAAPAAAIDVRDIIKVYKDGPVETVALRGATLAIAAGEYVALCGPSGCGKSTLLNLIAGIALPTAGRILVDGQDIGTLAETERAALRRGKLGIVFQSENLFPALTAMENVQVPLRLAGIRRPALQARALLARVGLEARERYYPEQLSGGERQRVAVAAALALQPSILLADEVTGELDGASADGVLKLLEDLQRQRALTIIAVTHSPEAAARAGRRIDMLDGRILSQEVTS